MLMPAIEILVGLINVKTINIAYERSFNELSKMDGVIYGIVDIV